MLFMWANNSGVFKAKTCFSLNFLTTTQNLYNYHVTHRFGVTSKKDWESLLRTIERFWEYYTELKQVLGEKKRSTYINSLCQSTEVWPTKEEYFETCCHLYVNEINLFFTCKSILVSFSNTIVTKNIARYFLYNMYYTNSILA